MMGKPNLFIDRADMLPAKYAHLRIPRISNVTLH
jgi:hypothetical protein